MNLATALIKAWQVNCRVTLLILDHLPDDALAAGLSKRGGRNVYDQLAHLNNVRIGWLELNFPKEAAGCDKIARTDAPDRARLRTALEQSATAMLPLFEYGATHEGKVKNYKRDIVTFLGYLIAHEAHHRGNILLTVKENGFKIPEELKWDIWAWDKI